MSKTLGQKLRRTKGFSLIELLIVIVISMTLLSLVVYKIQQNVLTFTADAVVSQLISSSFDARYHALLGTKELAKCSFNINNAVKYAGITISTNAPASICEKTTSCPNQQTLCISGETFCYVGANEIIFQPFTGYANSNYIIFVSSENRKLGLVIYKTGTYNVIENIAGIWRYRSDLRDLYLQQKEERK